MRRYLLIAALGALSSGCLSGGDAEYARAEDRVPLGRMIAQLPAPTVSAKESSVPTRTQVLEAYARVEGRLADPKDNHAINRRMAELAMEVGEDAAIEGAENPYAGAVARYETLLANGVADQRDEILYQLSRAHDVSGNTRASLQYLDLLLAEFPDSVHAVEAHFRRGEMHFSAERYSKASADYASVVAAGEETSFHQNALYMLGWSQFKQSDLDVSLDHFVTLLATLLDDDRELTRAESELLDDTLRVSVLTLQYLDGAQTLAARMDAQGRPAWQHKLYSGLAADYVERERYLDGVATWTTFVDRNPLDAWAPLAQQELIRVLHTGGFPSDVLNQQEVFVTRFGVDSPYWAEHEDNAIEEYGDVLRDYLNVLASHAHAAVQAKAKKRRATREDYLAAARWYEESLRTFPDDETVPRYTFLLGELYTEAGEHQRAVTAYQHVSREHGDAPEAADAGYAAILGLGAMNGQPATGDDELALRLQIDAQIEYAMQFRDDPRAASVQASAANSLFSLGEYAQAMKLAQNLLDSWPSAEQGLRETALSIVGHGQFEAEDYAGSEQSYRQLLALTDSPDTRKKTTERLLATVYKQGELAEASEDLDTATEHYLRLAMIDANAELAVRGAFDAVALKEKQGDTAGAAALLAQLRQQHPDHALLRDAGVRLAAMHEKGGDGLAAATEFVRLADTESDAEVRRQSRYRAAELYLAAGEKKLALNQFDLYARNFSDPYGIRMEALHQMSVIAGQLGDTDQRKRWQRELIQAHGRAGAQNSARTTTLAAEADFALAANERLAFDAIRLQQPLARSLKQKQAALEHAVAAYERIAGYKVQEFVTGATFQIADLYTALAKAIIDSERPRDLNAAELEQYVLLLEEEAYPFEEKAIALHEINMKRSWEGIYDEWVKRSFAELKRMLPARFDKVEIETAYVESIH